MKTHIFVPNHPTGPRAVLGSQRQPTRRDGRTDTTQRLRSTALQAEDGSRSGLPMPPPERSADFQVCAAIPDTFTRPRRSTRQWAAPTWRSALRSGCFGSLHLIVLFGLAAALFAGQPAGEEGRGRFRAVDIYLDSKSAPLAAYQLEFAATNGAVKIVGIEGGEHRAFREAPFYDPKAIQLERVIIAAFSTEPAAKLPTGKTKVATIHIQITGLQEPAFELKLQAAADSQGNKISVEASFEEQKAK